MDSTELAQDGIEHSHHAHTQSTDSWTLKSAMLIAALAAGAVVTEMSANDAQTQYLAAHIAASDTWTQYQAKSIRRTIYLQSIAMEDSAGSKNTRVTAAKSEADRMLSEPGKDGMKQLAERAKAYELLRDRELHLHDAFELAVRGLQISVVLTSLSVATRMRWLLLISSILGGSSAIYASAVGLRLF